MEMLNYSSYNMIATKFHENKKTQKLSVTKA